MYVCKACGGDLVFNPKIQKLQCQYCRKQYAPESVEQLRLSKAGEIIHQNQNDDGYKAISYKCSHCGAELITTNETISTFCSFCRTGTLVEREIIKKRKPDYIIPFKISKKECEEIYVNKIKNALLAPKSMIETQEVEKIRGIYMPYWIYNFEKHGNHSAKGSKYSHRSGDYVYYDDYSLETKIDAECKGIIHDATSNFSDRLSEAIAPFSVKEKKEFSPSYLSGYYADNEDVDEKVYTEESEDIASDFISKELRKDKTYHKYKSHPKVDFNEQKAELALFPVYFLVTKNKTGDRVSYAVINGQTGRIAADIPVDTKKFFMISLIFILPIFFLLNYFVTFSMPKLVICSLIFNIISIIILKKQNKKIENIENDKGKQYKENKTYNNQNSIDRNIDKNVDMIKNNRKIFIITVLLLYLGIPLVFFSFKVLVQFYSKQVGIIIGIIILLITAIVMIIKKVKNPKLDTSYYKLLIGLIATISMFFFRPASDIYYYAVAMFSIGITILSFFNILEKYNIMSTRKLPQLEKRGGDENA